MNSLVRVPQAGVPAVGTQDGQWMWDGTQWVCVGCDGSTVPPFPCPPPGFPPAGCPPWFSGMNSPPWYPGANAGVSFGSTAPSNAVRGHFWWNGKVLAIFDGAVWVNTATGAIIDGGTNGGGNGSGGTGTVIISTTPPGNPVAGMQWWNGSVLQVYDGTKWNVVGPGSGTGPVPTTTNTFALTQNTDVTISAAAWTIVPFTGTPQIDTTLGWDSVTRRFTPKKAGVYNFMIRAFASAGNDGFVLAKNDDGSFDPTLQTENLIITMGNTATGLLSGTGMTVMNGTTDFVRYYAITGNGLWRAVGSSPAMVAWLMP